MNKNKIMKLVELGCICNLIQKKLKNKDYELVLYEDMHTKEALENELSFVRELIQEKRESLFE